MHIEKIKVETFPNDKISEEVLRKYWEYEAKDFCFKAKLIAEQISIQPHKLAPLISKYSKVSFDKGICECGKQLSDPIHNRNEFRQAVNTSI